MMEIKSQLIDKSYLKSTMGQVEPVSNSLEEEFGKFSLEQVP